MVVITGHSSVEDAVEAMRAGAFDFIPKPFDSDRISIVVERAMERERLRRKASLLRQDAGESTAPLIGNSAKMQELRNLARRVAESDTTLLLLGESGSGKEVLARTIHESSQRAENQFVVVNCVALPTQLLDSELFGHERGSFTGAQRQHKGRFELARGGTILLDEIGATPSEVQLRLLRVLQEGTYERVGGESELRSDCRIIAATNRDLKQAVEDGEFLGDLYYRLNVVPIRVPPLRERKEDVPDLARLFVKRFGEQAGRGPIEITDDALHAMQTYHWPGNVRELENTIERAVVLGEDGHIGVEDLPHHIYDRREATPDALELGFHEAVETYKRHIIRRAMAKTGGNQSKAARILGIQRTYLSRLLKRMGLR